MDESILKNVLTQQQVQDNDDALRTALDLTLSAPMAISVLFALCDKEQWDLLSSEMVAARTSTRIGQKPQMDKAKWARRRLREIMRMNDETNRNHW